MWMCTWTSLDIFHWRQREDAADIVKIYYPKQVWCFEPGMSWISASVFQRTRIAYNVNNVNIKCQSSCCWKKWLFITTWLRLLLTLYTDLGKEKPCKWILSSALLFRPWVDMQEILLPIKPNVANLLKYENFKTLNFHPERPATTTSEWLKFLFFFWHFSMFGFYRVKMVW